MKIGELDVSKIYLGGSEISKIMLGTSQVYSGGSEPTPPTPPHDYSQDYLTIESLESGNTIYFKADGNSIVKTISASTDNGVTWRRYTASTGASGTTIATLDTGEKVLLKGLNSYYGIFSNQAHFNKINTTARFNVYGNIMSMISGDSFSNADTLASGAFLYFFNGCSGMISAENLILPATTLGQYCYNTMFYDCTSLTSAPSVLPATTLADYCYGGMFTNCTSLVTAPELSATTLGLACCRGMFQNCTSLTTAPSILPATTLVNDDYILGGCYENMFSGCTSLTTAPELPATTLTNKCYQRMFYGCTSLNYIKCLATDISASQCISQWVSRVSSTGTFVKAASMSSWGTGTSGIPDGWTVEDDWSNDE